MTLGNEDNPVIEIRKQEGELQGEAWIGYDEVMMYEDSGHILRDLTWHTSIITRHEALGQSLKREGSNSTQPETSLETW